MGTTADKLLYIQGTKEAIHDAIVAKGVTIATGTPFRSYATKIADIAGGSGGTQVEWTQEYYEDVMTANEWVKPTEWLSLPDNMDGVQKVSILNAVYDTDSEFVAFYFAGDYTVDWGDGVTENFAANVKAEHKYTYSSGSLNSATVSAFGYKQCVITITPQASNNLTTINLDASHTLISGLYKRASGFLDIRINSAYCTSLSTIGGGYVGAYNLKRCLLGELNVTSFYGLFSTCYALEKVTVKDTSSITSMNSMFSWCTSMRVPPMMDTSNVTDFGGMFYANYSLITLPPLVFTAATTIYQMFINCYSLEFVPPMNTPLVTVLNSLFSSNKSLQSCPDLSYGAATDTSGMFYKCSSLKTIPLLNTANVVYMNSMFEGCSSLETIPLLNTANVTNMSSMFRLCSSLETIPLLNTAKVTNMSSMFYSCSSLETIPLLNTSNVTNMSSMFYDCASLRTIPLLNTAKVTDMSSIFRACKALVNIPLLNTSKVTNIGYMFYDCAALQYIPALDFSLVTSASNFITGAYSLSRVQAQLKYSFTVANSKMSATALNEMYTALATVSGQTVTVTGNYGVSGDNPTIATAKGWTVTG